MFKGLVEILRQSKKTGKTSKNVKITTNFQTKDKLNVTQIENILKIEVLENCTEHEFYQELPRHVPKKQIIKLENIISKCQSQRKTIYLVELDTRMYCIEEDYPELKILETFKQENNQIERKIVIDQYKKTYCISKRICNDTGEIQENIEYDSRSPHQKSLCQIRKKLKEEARILLKNLKAIPDLQKELNMRNIYHDLNLLLEGEYCPVIQGTAVTLSLKFPDLTAGIQNDRMQSFHIVLEETKEIVGEISYNYITEAGFTYGGNISYYISELFRGNHYATEALTLLKELLKDNKFEGDKDLYIATTPENERSGRVAQNNGAKLVYEGEVPENDLLRTLDGVRDVKVYQIKMNK